MKIKEGESYSSPCGCTFKAVHKGIHLKLMKTCDKHATGVILMNPRELKPVAQA